MTNEACSPSPCSAFADLLVDFSDREVPDEQQTLIPAHVESCAGCREWLALLDASRDVLMQGIQYEQSPAVSQISISGGLPVAHGRPYRAITLTAAAAALILALGLVTWFGKQATNETGRVRDKTAMPSKNIDTVHLSPPISTDATRQITPDEALWRIALFEQQARLRASLELLPQHSAFAEQRAIDERLLAKFQSISQSDNLQ
jgi:hypothetical protein